METQEKFCRHCGKLLADGVRSDKVFCSAKCTAAYHRRKGDKQYKHQVSNEKHQHTCEVCGNIFIVNGYAQRKGEREARFCSVACKQKAYRERRKQQPT